MINWRQSEIFVQNGYSNLSRKDVACHDTAWNDSKYPIIRNMQRGGERAYSKQRHAVLWQWGEIAVKKRGKGGPCLVKLAHCTVVIPLVYTQLFYSWLSRLLREISSFIFWDFFFIGGGVPAVQKWWWWLEGGGTSAVFYINFHVFWCQHFSVTSYVLQ